MSTTDTIDGHAVDAEVLGIGAAAPELEVARHFIVGEALTKDVPEIEAQRSRRAMSTTCSGGRERAHSSQLPRSRGACEMSAFWQNEQVKLQPTVAMENARDPGKKW